MGIAERRQAEIEATKRKIIDATLEILAEDGYESLSIRKIANKIEYSPGIIYHYFKDKSEIVNCIVEEKYASIVKIIAEVPVDYENPQKTITDTLRVYIDFMLSSPEQFKAMLMNDVESVREKINMLDEGVSKKRKSMASLQQIVTLGIEKGKFREVDAELTAQIIWTSTYGLILRLILENNITNEQREKLINHHFDIIINGILK